AESIRALSRLAIPQRQMHQAHPRLRHGLMITSLQIVHRGAPRDREGLKPGADFRDGILKRMPAQVEVRDLDVVSVMKLLKRAPFERSEKFVVVHASAANDYPHSQYESFTSLTT